VNINATPACPARIRSATPRPANPMMPRGFAVASELARDDGGTTRQREWAATRRRP
jgi:hypothetical protein